MTTSKAISVQVCGPEADPAWMKYANVGTAFLALVVSGVAAYVTWRTFAFMRDQNRQARADSIRDEYWLRTVVSPSSIQPFQAFVAELRANLPGAEPPLTPPTPVELNAFTAVTAAKFNDFSMQFKSLALIDNTLCVSVETALQSIEDGLADYVSSLGAHINGLASTPPKRSEAVAQLTNGMVSLFKLIQDHQVNGQ